MEDINLGKTSDVAKYTPESLKPESIKAIQGEIPALAGWKDHGIVDVPVKDLPWPEDVTSPNDFDHHITWDDAKSATLQLPEIQKEVKAGKTRDDFSAEDQAAGKDDTNGKRRIYDLFYGSDPIRLSKDGDRYDIVNGHHRVFAAKELGLETIPARVIEKRK